MKYSDIFGFSSGDDEADVPLIGISGGTSEVSSNLARGLAATAAITAGDNVWETIVDIAGSGFLRGAAIYGASISTAHSLGLRITIDGVAYTLNKTTAGSNTPVLITTAALYGVAANETSPTPMYIPQSTLRHRFNVSLKIEGLRSLGSNSATVGYTYSLDRS